MRLPLRPMDPADLKLMNHPWNKQFPGECQKDWMMNNDGVAEAAAEDAARTIVTAWSGDLRLVDEKHEDVRKHVAASAEYAADMLNAWAESLRLRE